MRAQLFRSRVRLLAVTARGRRKLTQARRYWRKAQARMLERFGEDEWRRLEGTLRGLRRLVS